MFGTITHLYPQPDFTLYSEAGSHLDAFLGLGAHVLAAALMMRLYHKAWPSFKRTFLGKDVLLRTYENKHEDTIGMVFCSDSVH